MILKIINKLIRPYVWLGVKLGIFPVSNAERDGHPIRPDSWPSWMSPIATEQAVGSNVIWIPADQTVDPLHDVYHSDGTQPQQTSARKQAYTDDKTHQVPKSAQQEPSAHHTTMPDKTKVQGWVDEELKEEAKRVADQRGQSLSELVGNAVRKEVHGHQFEVLNDEYNLEEEIVKLSRAAAEKASEEIKEDIRRTLREEERQEDIPR